MGIKKIAKSFENASVCVVGMKRRGKDMLFGNVIARRKKAYISNTDYKCKKAKYHKLSLKEFDCGGNTYKNFINGDIKYYEFPYPDGTDIYISDCGVYFPSQFCNELNRDFKDFPTFFALSGQLGQCFVHSNCQNFSRIWDKIREHADVFYYCNWCKAIGKLVIQKVTYYERAESCQARIPTFKFKLPLFAKKEMKNLLAIEKEKYRIQHGEIKTHLLVYFNKSKYDTRIFKEMLKNGKKDNIGN